MDFSLKLALYAVSAELFRRFVTLLIRAFTGPLAKIPGPLVGKFTTLPWLVNAIQGETMNTIPELFKKYGEVVRTGERPILMTGGEQWTHKYSRSKVGRLRGQGGSSQNAF